MAYLSLYGQLTSPIFTQAVTGAPSYTSTLLDASGEYVCYVFQSPVTDTITEIGYRTGNVTTGGDLDIRVETVAGTGLSSGTLWGTNTNIVQTVAGTDDNVWKTAVLTSGASVNKGDLVAVVIKWSATFNGNIARFNGPYNSITMHMPYMVLNTGTPTFATTTFQHPLSVKFSSGGYVPILGFFPASNFANIDVTSSTTPDHVGNTFVPPCDGQITGVWLFGDFDGDCTVRLIGTDGTTSSATYTLDADTPPTAGSSCVSVNFSSPVAVTSGSTYRYVIDPTSASNCRLFEIQFNSSGEKGQMPGGQYGSKTTAKDPTGTGSWTDTSTSLMWMGVIWEPDIPAAGGGSTTASGVVGIQSIGTGVIA